MATVSSCSLVEAVEDVKEPFPISLVAGRYLLYDVNVVSYVRRTYRMCGCLIGTLPQIPQQNIFLGLPLELMNEEAALLVERGAAYIVDDASAHRSGLSMMLEADKEKYLKEREHVMRGYAEDHARAAQERKAKVLGKGKSKLGNTEPTRTGAPVSDVPESSVIRPSEEIASDQEEKEHTFTHKSTQQLPTKDTTIFEGAPILRDKISQETLDFYITPAASCAFHFLPSPPTTSSSLLPIPSPNSYPVYCYLNQRGYYLSPGLRFGAQYLAYPGDPLRFHSHFIVNGLNWDQEISVMDIVGGGRLGTGVKKGWMVGGRNPDAKESDEDRVRVFSIEWGGF